MADEPVFVEPLTRGNYKRLPKVERQIADTLTLGPEALVKRAQQRHEAAPGFLSAEALVYFIRRAIKNDDAETRNALCSELLERCRPHFSGKFRGFEQQEDREDLQSEVMKRIVEDLFAPDDRGDFMQVRFWKYLENKSIDACRKASRHINNPESLDENYSNNGVSGEQTRLEKMVDPRLSPEELAMISEGLAELPPYLRKAFLLRYCFGIKIGSDDSTEATGDELTIATHFGCSARTVRNWLKEADKRLASFREKYDGE